MWPISSGTAGAEGMSGKREIGREAAWLLFCAAAQISSSAATTRQEKSRGVPRLFSVSSVDFSCPQAHRRYAGFTRHIPALGVALKADLSPRPAAQPVRHEDFKGLRPRSTICTLSFYPVQYHECNRLFCPLGGFFAILRQSSACLVCRLCFSMLRLGVQSLE